eukprot:1194528-Prorocentrum_minimum.AAC.13
MCICGIWSRGIVLLTALRFDCDKQSNGRSSAPQPSAAEVRQKVSEGSKPNFKRFRELLPSYPSVATDRTQFSTLNSYFGRTPSQRALDAAEERRRQNEMRGIQNPKTAERLRAEAAAKPQYSNAEVRHANQVSKDWAN